MILNMIYLISHSIYNKNGNRIHKYLYEVEKFYYSYHMDNNN